MGLISENHPGITEEKQAGSFVCSPLDELSVSMIEAAAAVALSSSSLGRFKSVTEASLVASIATADRRRERGLGFFFAGFVWMSSEAEYITSQRFHLFDPKKKKKDSM